MDRTKPATPPTAEEIEDFAHRLLFARPEPAMDAAAEKLFDRVRALLPHFAFIVWQPDDMEQFTPDWTDEQRRQWMFEYNGKVRDAAMQTGWDDLKILIDCYPLEEMDNG